MPGNLSASSRLILSTTPSRFQPAAESAQQEQDDAPSSGWGWLEAAVWEAVEAGSAFVAPRRLREILLRWGRDGFPQPRDPQPPRPAVPVGPPRRIARVDEAPTEPRPAPPVFVVEEVGLSNRQVWAAALAELAGQGGVSRADLETWLRPAALIGRDGETLVVGAPNAVARDRIATRLLPALRQALAATIGAPLAVAVVVDEETAERHVATTASAG